MKDRTDTLVERLRATKTQYRTYGMFGCVGIQDEEDSREVPVNPDGPEAADRIEALTEALTEALLNRIDAPAAPLEVNEDG